MRRGKETRSVLLAALRENPSASHRDLAWKLGRNISSVWHSVRLLVRKGLIRESRCPHCGGKYWEVVE